MARKFEKFQRDGKQYGLRATSAVSPGTVLYVAEPYAYTVQKPWWGRVCEFCLSPQDHLLRCSQCKFARYCSKTCQVEAWPDHKRECKCIKNYNTPLVTDPVRLVGKIIFKMLRKAPCPSEELLSVSELEPVLIQQGILVQQGNEIEENIEWLTEMLLLYLQEEITDPSQLPSNVNLPELFAKVLVSRVIIINEELIGVAVGLYPSMSLLRHSCEPNCTGVFMGRLQHLRAVRKIEAGEELTMALVDTMLPTKERQAWLKKLYYLDCDCRRCQTNDQDEHKLAGDKEASDESEQVVKRILELRSNSQWGDMLTLCKAQLQRNVGRVPDQNIYQMKILDCAMDACRTLHLPKEAMRYGYRTLAPYRLYSRGIDAARALYLIRMGFILEDVGKKSKAVNMFTEALEELNIFYGKDHPMIKKLTGILETWLTR